MPNHHTRQKPQLSKEQSNQLQGWLRRRKTAQGLAFRARIVLACAAGESDASVALELETTRQTVGKWRRRFVKAGCDGLLDERRPGSPRKISDEDVERVVVNTLESQPKGRTHWSIRSMSKGCGLSRSSVRRIWRAFGLKPHLIETFTLSTDPLFIDKVRDIVGLYLNPPERAVVLCVDEKSQIQALERKQPMLPMTPGQPERRTHTYKRNGTTSLFAALNIATGHVIGKCFKRHRSVEFKRFLGRIDRAVPKDQEVHLVLDNYSTHKTAMIHNWLLKRPRFHLHFTPTSTSWINLVESWFAKLTSQKLLRGNYRSTAKLERDIEEFLQKNNEELTPFVWTKTADEILENLKRYCESISGPTH